MKRVTGRYSCTQCGTIYNSYFNNTKTIGKCDYCGSVEFSKRNDDSEEVIVERLKVFKQSTKPLLDYYKNRLIVVKADEEIASVSSRILENLK